MDGDSLGIEEGWVEILGFSDGCIVTSCVQRDRKVREICITTLVFNEYEYEYTCNACLILLTCELGTPEIDGFSDG